MKISNIKFFCDHSLDAHDCAFLQIFNINMEEDISSCPERVVEVEGQVVKLCGPHGIILVS